MRRGFIPPVLIIQGSQPGCTYPEKVYPRKRLFFQATTLQPPQGIMNVLRSPLAKKVCAERLVALSWVHLPSPFSPLQFPAGSMQWRGVGLESWEGGADRHFPLLRWSPGPQN